MKSKSKPIVILFSVCAIFLYFVFIWNTSQNVEAKQSPGETLATCKENREAGIWEQVQVQIAEFNAALEAQGPQTLGEALTKGKKCRRTGISAQVEAARRMQAAIAAAGFRVRNIDKGLMGAGILEEGRRYKAIVCGANVEFLVLRIREGGEWADVMVEKLNFMEEMREGKIRVEMCGLIVKLE